MPPQKRKASRAVTTQRPANQGSNDEEPPAPSTKRPRLLLRGETPASTIGQDAESLPADAASGNYDAAGTGGAEAGPPGGNRTGKADNSGKKGLDTSLPPIHDVREMMEDMVKCLDPAALKQTHCKLEVGTLCSGTEAPIFALNMILDALQAKGSDGVYEVEHKFSCEIEPYKQGFIHRNTPPGTLIFRNVVEMAAAARTGEA